MTDILARWQSKEKSDDVIEREAERQWSWILSRFQISEALTEPSNVRSLAGQWSHFSKSLFPGSFLLKDLEDLVFHFSDYLMEKKKDFPKKDIASFVAWKFWEAKILHRRVFSPEIHPCTVAWAGARRIVTEVFESANRTRKTRRKAIAESIAQKLYPAFDGAKKEDKKQILADIDGELKEILAYDDKDLFDAVQDCVTRTIHEVIRGTVDPAYLPLFFASSEDDRPINQVEGSKEAA